MKKFLKSDLGKSAILIAASLLNLIFTIAYYSTKMTDYVYDNYVRGELTLWSANRLYIETHVLKYFNTIVIVAFFVGLLLFAISALLSLWKKKHKAFYISAAYNLTLSLVMLFVHIATKILRGGAVACVVISIIISTAILVYLIIQRKNEIQNVEAEKQEEQAIQEVQHNIKPLKLGMLICECVATAIYLFTLFIPVYSETSSLNVQSYYLIASLSNSSYPLHMNIAFIVMFATYFGGVLYFVSTIADFARSTKDFIAKSQRCMYFATFMSALFFAVGYGLTFYINIKHADSTVYSAKTVSYIPSFLSVAALIAFSVLQGRVKIGSTESERGKKSRALRIEPLIYVVLITVVTFAALAFNLIELKVSYGGMLNIQDTKLTGYELLKNYRSLEGGFQLMAFILTAILLISGIMLVISLVSFFAKSNDFYKAIKVSAFTNFIFMLALGLFGIYFMIAQKVNEENILALLKYFNISVISLDFVQKVSSKSYVGMILSFAVLMLMLVRGQFNLSADPIVVETAESDKSEKSAGGNSEAALTAGTTVSGLPSDFDVCPAFTELDAKLPQFNAELNKRRENLFANLTLPNLVRFVVDYARECRLHLSYSLEDMATFVAGLGASRLSILQGMSGTGKTSLPKIFTEALMGNCEIVEVESSWRDKNELLGYYNEFSKCYTPKKFTQCLYKAKLNSSVLTFIVLDEMNLSRIEYYFSDFLSLMENEEDKREIKLLNIKLFRKENGENIPYLGLTDGHTIKMPANVWFIGTANRDESTFEISDKVYDRAQTMNFDKRAPKIHSFSEPLPQKFASYDMITKLFDEAKIGYVFEAEDNAIIQKAEKLLAPYNISFGNRILKQMEDFVKIYCTCFGDKSAVENDAVEKILLSKVVSKLENKIVENKEALANEFSKLGLSKCSAFIQKLNED